MEITIYDRMNLANLRGQCTTFQWVGQPFYSCDRCGRPYWAHTHEQTVEHDTSGRTPFSTRKVWKVIPEDKAEKTRRIWEPVMRADKALRSVLEPSA